MRLVIDRGALRAAVERSGEGYAVRVYDRATPEGRRYQPCAASGTLPTLAAAQRWAAARLAEKVATALDG